VYDTGSTMLPLVNHVVQLCNAALYNKGA